MRILTGVAALAAMCGTMPAGARCWSQDEVAAAQVRDMQTMLMVAALRCRATGVDILPDYNGFVRANRGAIATMNDRIKARFRADAGPVDGQARYDRFTTQLANAYGSGVTDADACADAANLARSASVAGQSPEALAGFARQAVFATPLPEAACTLPPALVAAASPGPSAPAGDAGVVLAAATPGN